MCPWPQDQTKKPGLDRVKASHLAAQLCSSKYRSGFGLCLSLCQRSFSKICQLTRTLFLLYSFHPYPSKIPTGP